MDERSQAIVQTAIALAEEAGYAAVRLRDVAERAGVALGTVYRRFRSKEDILVAALDRDVRTIGLRFLRDPVDAPTRILRIERFFSILTGLMVKRPNFARAVLRAVASGEPELTERVAHFHGFVSEMIVAAMRGASAPSLEEQAQGEDEEQLSAILQQIWFAALVGWAGGLHPEEEVVSQVRRAAEILMRGMGMEG